MPVREIFKTDHIAVTWSETTCWKCGKPTQVKTLALLRPYTVNGAPSDAPYLLSHIKPAPAIQQLARFNTQIELKPSNPAEAWALPAYLANPCGHCNMAQRDFKLFGPGGAFGPGRNHSALPFQHSTLKLTIEALRATPL